MGMKKVFILLVWCLASSCSSVDNTVERLPGASTGTLAPAPINVIATATKTDTSTSLPIHTQTTPPCQSTIDKITKIKAKRLWWEDADNQLHFLIENGRTGYWDSTDKEVILDLTANLPKELQPSDDIRVLVPEGVEDKDIYVSTSGNQAVYREKIYPGPTPTPQTMGIPSGEPDISVDLFWVKVGNPEPVYLGRLDGVPTNFIWSQDEMKLLLGTAAPRIAKDTYVWIVDFTSLSVKSVLRRDDFENPDTGSVIDFTPDGNRFLFNKDGERWIYNLVNGEKRPLTIKLLRYYWWITNRSMIVIQPTKNQFGANWGVFLYEVEKDVAREISEIPIPPDFLWPDSIAISPNFDTIYFIDKDMYINVLTLCY
jgi:hypothetical protein